MPPPAVPSTLDLRDLGLQLLLHLLRLLHHGCMFPMFPGIFIRSGLLQVADGAHFAAEQFSKTLHFRMREGAFGNLIRLARRQAEPEPARFSFRRSLL
jgi:hypothetical protein